MEWNKDFLIQYYCNRHKMDNGDLLEFSARSFIGSAIRWVTKKDVNHTALLWCVDEFKNIQDRKFVMEAISTGLELNLLSLKLNKYKGDVYWYPLKPRWWAYRDTVASNCLLAEGRTDEMRYDYLSIVRQLFGKVSVDVAKTSFCSEFAQWVLQKSGVIKKQKNALRPGEFDKLGIYEDRVKIYSWNGK